VLSVVQSSFKFEVEMDCLAVIPSRYASQRFPAKPLALIAGRPMVQWVYEAACRCEAFFKVAVATDHPEIARVVSGFGGHVEMTRSDHLTGTDRVAEVAQRYPHAEVIANVQGDQPFVTAEMLSILVEPLSRPDPPHMATLGCPLPENGHDDPNTVKVLCNQRMRALYFTRAAAPYYRQRLPAPVYHHLGLYAFRRDFLATYATLAPTPFEQCEQLEQLRALENGYELHVGLTPAPIIEVNTPDDLERANELVASHPAYAQIAGAGAR
jgi:3-deoxy-manno-octulosonate cytidylyltransferase (CMP-KDO synthetase)